MEKYQQLRTEYPLFVYKNYHIDEEENIVNIRYDFEIVGLAEFHPEWKFPKSALFNESIINDKIFEQLVFSLGMVEAISYWKATCSPEMKVECGELSNEQIEWWKKLYFGGLGEFFYVNKINTDIESFMNITHSGSFRSNYTPQINEKSGCLVPIGGGKDSALTLETLKNNGMNCVCYSINSRCSIVETVKAAGIDVKNLITAKRLFDRSLIEINKKGFLNGHTPFSAIVAFSAEITAYLYKLKYIVLSNESSANESTVAGQNVNHQYSKSFEFEFDFNQYEKKYLCTGAYYFSFLRPLAEFQIAAMFVNYKQYLSVFRSCNLGSKHSPDIWCGECPKCLFICLMLSPFIGRGELTELFGSDILDKQNMIPSFLELLGLTEHKPFECVGSIEEVNLAVTLAILKYERENAELPRLFIEYKNSGLYSADSADDKYRKCMTSYNNQNLLPTEFAVILKKEMERLL